MLRYHLQLLRHAFEVDDVFAFQLPDVLLELAVRKCAALEFAALLDTDAQLEMTRPADDRAVSHASPFWKEASARFKPVCLIEYLHTLVKYKALSKSRTQ